MTTNTRTEQMILLALFKCTNEQATFLIDKYRHKLKQDFNVWLNIGFKIMDQLEKQNPEQAAEVQEIADQLHNIIQIAKNDNNG